MKHARVRTPPERCLGCIERVRGAIALAARCDVSSWKPAGSLRLGRGGSDQADTSSAFLGASWCRPGSAGAGLSLPAEIGKARPFLAVKGGKGRVLDYRSHGRLC
jgi:hypothetical protein